MFGSAVAASLSSSHACISAVSSCLASDMLTAGSHLREARVKPLGEARLPVGCGFSVTGNSSTAVRALFKQADLHRLQHVKIPQTQSHLQCCRPVARHQKQAYQACTLTQEAIELSYSVRCMCGSDADRSMSQVACSLGLSTVCLSQATCRHHVFRFLFSISSNISLYLLHLSAILVSQWNSFYMSTCPSANLYVILFCSVFLYLLSTFPCPSFFLCRTFSFSLSTAFVGEDGSGGARARRLGGCFIRTNHLVTWFWH